MNAIRRPLLWMILLFALLLPACRPALPAPQVTVQPAAVTPTALAAETAIQAPSATPEPSPTPAALRLLLLAPPEADPGLSASLESSLAEMAQAGGLRFQRVSGVDAAGLAGEPARLVVSLGPVPNLAELAAAAPETQFLAIGGVESAAGNLSVLRAGAASSGTGNTAHQAAFLAGYLGAVITPQWRVGALLPAGGADNAALRQAFTNGVVFYCGLCRPAYPPFGPYPTAAEAAGADTASLQAAADSLLAQGIQTVYVLPGAGEATLLEYLAAAGVAIIGSDPPPAGAQNRWVASIRSTDVAAAAKDMAARLLAGESALSQSAGFQLADVNENLLSPGKQRLIEQMLSDLNAGWIDPGVGGTP